LLHRRGVDQHAKPPHWFHFWAHPDYPTDPRMAYAMAYSEPEALDKQGRPVPANAWTAYVRPAFPGDPPDAPTWEHDEFIQTGRLVRYVRRGDPWSGPWPLPAPGDSNIKTDDGLDADGPNPIVTIASNGVRTWCPMVLHTAERLTSGLRLPVQTDHCQIGEELDHGMSSALHTANLQGFGQPVYRGAGSPPTVLGPSNVVHVQDPAGDFSYAAPNGDATGHFELVHKIAQIAGVLESLPADSFTYPPPSIETGPAKLARSAALIQERSKRTVEAERPEHQRFDLERLLHNAYGKGARIPVDTSMVVRWGELSAPPNWEARLREMAAELNLGLSDKIDLIMERHGVSRDEAERRAKSYSVRADGDNDGDDAPEGAATPTGDADPGVAEPGDTDGDGAGKPNADALAADPQTAFNGAQVQAMVELIQSVAAKALPAESARQILTVAFPVTAAQAAAMVAPAETMAAQKQETPTVQPPAPDGPSGEFPPSGEPPTSDTGEDEEDEE
jgi:hypothetical protein